MGMMALYTGATGMKTLSRGLEVVGNNLANVNTIGFKQQMALYEDLKYNDVSGASVNGARRTEGGAVGHAQMGKGVRLADIRTIHKQAAFEIGNEVTDLGISGKGFFGVSKDGVNHFTRAGNFRFDKEGNLTDPHGFILQAYPITDGTTGGAPVDVKLPLNAQGKVTLAATPTTETTAILNIGDSSDRSADATNPFFSLASAWDGTQAPPLGEGAFTYSQPLTAYDSTGAKQELTIYFDGAGTGINGQKTIEFIVTADPSKLDGADAKGKGLLMSGTLTFDASNQIANMSAFTPTGDPSDLANWSPATLTNGKPQFNVGFTGATPQDITLDLGISASGGAWAGGSGTADTVGTDPANLPSMSTPTVSSRSTTAYTGSSSALVTSQNGFTDGYLQNISIDRNGIMTGNFSNGQSDDMYQITTYRFTSEYNLKREGNNHFSATVGSGEPDPGKPDTENYGFIASQSLEQSNVDMATEFVQMITHQRGFQANSKIITTQEDIIRKTIDIKR